MVIETSDIIKYIQSDIDALARTAGESSLVRNRRLALAEFKLGNPYKVISHLRAALSDCKSAASRGVPSAPYLDQEGIKEMATAEIPVVEAMLEAFRREFGDNAAWHDEPKRL